MTNTPSPTDEDRKLIAKARDRIHDAPMPTENMIDELADRLESLLSDRAKLEEALRRLEVASTTIASRLDMLSIGTEIGQAIEEARAALNRSTDRG